VQQFFRMLGQAQRQERADDHAGGEIAENSAEPQPLEQGHKDTGDGDQRQGFPECDFHGGRLREVRHWAFT